MREIVRHCISGWAIVPVVNGEGDGRLADAYNLANTTPNIIFELVLGGILSATLVPIFTRAFASRDDDVVAQQGSGSGCFGGLWVVGRHAAARPRG